MKFEFKTLLFLGLIILILSLKGCALPLVINSSNIITEHDEVKSSKRFKYSNSYQALEKHSPLVLLDKTFYKEIDSTNQAIVKIYDVIKLNKNANIVEDTIYVIIDQVKIFPIKINNIKLERTKEVEPQKENVVKSDSTNIEVVTSYNEYYYNIIKFNYLLPDTIQQAILKGNELKFRYYEGANMITIKIERKKLEKIKVLLNI